MHVDIRTLRSTAQIEGEEDTRLIRGMRTEAERFLRSFSWCAEIVDSYYGQSVSVGGVAAVFLFHIVPAKDDIDEWLWVVVGDLSPAYLVTDDAATPEAALEAYIEEMTQWVEAVRSGNSLEDVIPVDAPADEEHAAMLESRLGFLRRNVLDGVGPPTPNPGFARQSSGSSQPSRDAPRTVKPH